MTLPTERTIEAGGLTFQVEYRHFGGDRGPAIRVFAPVGEETIQLLRFDCFEKDPHYHYDPEGKNRHWSLPKSEVPDPVAWSLEKLGSCAAEMVRDAGFPEVAAKVDVSAVTRAISQVEAAIREMTPPQLGLTGIHHTSVVVTNPDRARAFYSGILGLQEVKYPSTFKFPVIWFDLGEEQVHLIIRNEADTFSPRHFALHVQDAVAARKALKAKGVEIRETVEIPGADRFFVTDPDGNQIELIQWKVPWGKGPM